MTDSELEQKALEWVKKNHRLIVDRVTEKFDSFQQNPVAIFMAGSPGAGKTEFSKRLIEQILDYQKYIIRIDPDEIRTELPDYVPGKAETFNKAVVKAVEKILDHVFKFEKSFLLDGTFAHLEVARKNILRSLNKKRIVKIQYLYQDPVVAWEFTQKREVVEGRNIPKDAFIRQFFAARDNIGILKKEFGKAITIDLIVRDIKLKKYDVRFNIDNIDKYLKREYNEEILKKIL